MTIGAVPSPTPTQVALENAMDQQHEDEFELSQDLASIVAMVHKGADSIEEAFMLVMELVMPKAMGIKEDQTNTKAAQLNIASSLSQIVTNITNDVNGIKVPQGDPSSAAYKAQVEKNNAAATDLITQCNSLSSILGSPTLTWQGISPTTGQPTEQTTQWIDEGTLSNALQSLNGLTSLVGTSSGEATVVANIVKWLANPSSGKPQTGEQNISSMNSDMAGMDNAFGGLSQLANNAVQLLTGIFNQLQKCTSTLMQDFVNFEKVAAQNQKTG